MADLYTIGYANKSIDEFLSILKDYKINCIIDVRSVPASSQFPEYNEKKLEKELKSNKIEYMSFKKEFGARRTEDDVYSKVNKFDDSNSEVVIFEKVYNLDIFKQGVKRILHGLEKGYRICFLCSEKYAYNCHRCIMVGEYFNRLGYCVEHIVDSSHILNQNNIEKILMEEYDSSKREFEKKHSEELKKFQYGGTLFETNVDYKNIEYWEKFFSNYTYEKSIYLKNLEIGYQKGNNDNG